MKIDVYKRMAKTNTLIGGFTKEFIFAIDSPVVPVIGEILFVEETGVKYEVISVTRNLISGSGNTYTEERFCVEVMEKEAYKAIDLKTKKSDYAFLG